MGETESTRAVVYTRVNHAARGNSGAAEVAAEHQRDACRAVAKERGLIVIAEYSDVTGAVCIEQRPALQRMLDELTACQIGYVVVSDLARISRNVRDLTGIEERLTRVGAELLVVGEGHEQIQARRRMTSILADYGTQQKPRVSHRRDGRRKDGGRV